MEIGSEIKRIAESIKATEGKRQTLAGFLKEIGGVTKLVKTLQPGFEGDIVGVDGGLVKKSLHGFDCMLTRAVAVCFSYQGGKVKSARYWPSRIPQTEPAIMDAFSDLDWSYYTSIRRAIGEVRAAQGAARAFNPSLVLMDGMIAPHYADKPGKGSPANPAYEELLAEYRKLYGIAPALAGVVEDSRSNVFCMHIKEDVLGKVSHPRVKEIAELLERTRDTSLLYLVMEKGQRSLVFPYTKNASEHPVLRDLGEWGHKVFSFYLKTAQWDRPVRVDFLSKNGSPGSSSQVEAEADWIGGSLLAVSGRHARYGMPEPLIEADSIAKIPEPEMEAFYDQVLSLTGNLPSIMRLRREERPF